MSAEDAPQLLPMFPLGTNVFPTQILPLHIFEPRYRQLMEDLVADRDPDGPTPTFGVVMIERGSETGGGDVRADVATRVEVIEAEQYDDGRWGVITAGVERVSVLRWLDDDPYPRAEVTVRRRVDTGGTSLADVEDLLERTLEVGAALIDAPKPDLSQLSDDPLERLDQMSAVAPLTAFDRQQVLEATSTDRQIALLLEALEGKFELLRLERDRRATD